MKKVIYDIKNDTYEKQGEVLSYEDQRYSSTHVSGGGSYASVNNGVTSVTRVPVTTTVNHHHYQTVWIKDQDGNEASHELYNQDIEVREGHDIAFIINKSNSHYERFINLSTGQYWRLRTRSGPTGFFGRFFQRVVMLFYALLVSLPLINAFMMLASVIDVIRNKTDYYINSNRRRIYAGVFSVFVLLGHYPLISIVSHEMNIKSPVPNDLSYVISPEFQRDIFSMAAFVSLKMDKASENDLKIIKDLKELSTNEFIKEHKLKEKEIKAQFVFYKDRAARWENYQYRDGDPTNFSYSWFAVFYALSWFMMYLHFMNSAKSMNRVSVLLDERAKEIQKEYDEDKLESAST